MKRMKQENNNYGIGFVGLLQIVFITLKLCEVINWKWIWVLAPCWIYVALITLLFIVLMILKITEAKRIDKLTKRTLEKTKEIEKGE